MTFVLAVICITLRLIFVPVFGTIFFPLSSVNITLQRTLNVTYPLPPLVELYLLHDFSTVHRLTNSTKFILESNGYYNNLFYIHGHELRIRDHYFTESFEPSQDLDYYKLLIRGYLGDNEPANMTIFVLLDNTPLNCTRHLSELCFWNASSYTVAEGLDDPILGSLSSPLTSALCPQFTVTYKVLKAQEKIWGVRRQENGSGPWSLFLLERIERESKDIVNYSVIRVKCTVKGEGVQNKTTKDITIDIRDIDDSLPVLNFTAVDLTQTYVNKGDILARGIVTDNDSPKKNHLKFFVESKDLPMEVSCNNTPSFYQSDGPNRTLLDCYVIASAEKNITSDITFKVIAVDVSLVPGYGNNTKRADLVMKAFAVPIASAFTLKSNVYDDAEIFLPASPAEWVRVTSPIGMEKSLFYTESEYFDVTETEGIVYVKNGKKLVEGMTLNLNIKWTGIGRKAGSQEIVIKIDAPSICKGSHRDSWCSKNSRNESCWATCGYGLKRLSKEGGCFWLESGGTQSNAQYSTCTASPLTCPDKVCDSLEKLKIGLCPQDCIKNVIGSGSTQNKIGIQDGNGICFWEPDSENMFCMSQTTLDISHNKHNKSISKTIPKQNDSEVLESPQDSIEICDENCKVTMCIVVSCFFTAFFALLLIVRERRRRHKRCPPCPGKEEMMPVNYEEYVRRPLQESEPPTRPDYYDAKWEFPRHRLTIEETIGEGEFGMVLKARADGIHDHNGSKTVAVKTLKNGAKDNELGDLISELELLKDVDHPNIIKLLGACTTDDGPLYVIIEYAEHGSLRNFLKKHRKSRDDKDGSSYLESVGALTPKRFLTFAWHIAKGMAYLTEMKLVHRDLAARNVLLTKDLVCKISDFGLTRDIYEDDAYLKRSKGRVPIKWMAIESLEDQVYTTKSDVWSFGVLLWEIVTLCSSPYPGVAPQNLFKLLQDGYRMERPTNCSIELYAVMRACWAKLPVHRPSFAALVQQLDAMLSADREYLDLAPSAVENRQYMENPQFQWKFQSYDHPKGPCGCPPEHCSHSTHRRYENEQKTCHTDLWEAPSNIDDTLKKKDIGNVIKIT